MKYGKAVGTGVVEVQQIPGLIQDIIHFGKIPTELEESTVYLSDSTRARASPYNKEIIEASNS